MQPNISGSQLANALHRINSYLCVPSRENNIVEGRKPLQHGSVGVLHSNLCPCFLQFALKAQEKYQLKKEQNAPQNEAQTVSIMIIMITLFYKGKNLL